MCLEPNLNKLCTWRAGSCRPLKACSLLLASLALQLATSVHEACAVCYCPMVYNRNPRCRRCLPYPSYLLSCTCACSCTPFNANVDAWARAFCSRREGSAGLGPAPAKESDASFCRINKISAVDVVPMLAMHILGRCRRSFRSTSTATIAATLHRHHRRVRLIISARNQRHVNTCVAWCLHVPKTRSTPARLSCPQGLCCSGYGFPCPALHDC